MRVRAAVAVAVLLGLAACGDATTPGITPSGQPSAGPTVSPAIEDGRHFGWVRSVDLGGATLEFDRAEFLTGDEANEAAEEDGVVSPGEGVPNDYYIRNPDTSTVTIRLGLAPGIEPELVVVDWGNCCESTSGELEPWAESFDDPEYDGGAYRGDGSPYWVTVVGRAVVKVEEQYLP